MEILKILNQSITTTQTILDFSVTAKRVEIENTGREIVQVYFKDSQGTWGSESVMLKPWKNKVFHTQTSAIKANTLSGTSTIKVIIAYENGTRKSFSVALTGGITYDDLAQLAGMGAAITRLVFKSADGNSLNIKFSESDTPLVLPPTLGFDSGDTLWNSPKILVNGSGAVDGYFIE